MILLYGPVRAGRWGEPMPSLRIVQAGGMASCGRRQTSSTTSPIESTTRVGR